MAHFYVTTDNSRGGVVTAAGRKEGQTTHARGWNAGVKVSAYVDALGNDYFAVYATDGSKGGREDRFVGAVHHDGSWHPA